MFLLIILNVLAVIAESMSWVKEAAFPRSRTGHVCLQIYRVSQAAGSYVLNGFELFSVLVFTFEYSANVWSAPANSRPKFQSEHTDSAAPNISCLSGLHSVFTMHLEYGARAFDYMMVSPVHSDAAA